MSAALFFLFDIILFVKYTKALHGSKVKTRYKVCSEKAHPNPCSFHLIANALGGVISFSFLFVYLNYIIRSWSLWQKTYWPKHPSHRWMEPCINPDSVPAGAEHLPHKGPGEVIVGKTGLEISSSCHLFHVWLWTVP